jgi:CubicO group peptidase (beta-lactamase class C family)
VRHLLLHTSGLPDYVGLLARGNVDYEDRTTPAEALAALQQVEALDFEPGTKWAYSNTNYFLLAGIVECVAGQPLPEFAQQRIFGPLGMENTRVHADCRRLVPNRALSYSKAAGGEWRWNFSNWEQLGDGAVLTTVGDLERWARNFATGTVGGKAWQQAMAGPGTLDDGQPIDYGMGLGFKTQAGRRFVAHGGAWAGYRAELLRVPDEQLTVVCLSNRADLAPTRICADIAKIMAAR